MEKKREEEAKTPTLGIKERGTLSPQGSREERRVYSKRPVHRPEGKGSRALNKEKGRPAGH